jgi:hypothetical protein
MSRPNPLVSIALAFATSIALTSCKAAPEPVEPEAAASVEPQLSFFPSGSAGQNLAVFENVLSVSGAGKPGHKLSDSITLLIETGFALEYITHTPVATKIGDPADSVSLAVEFNGNCLISQFSSSWLTTAVVEPTVSGCLIGDVEQASLESD